MTGVVFDIKEFSVFDGPGIRQTVFLKGCPLRCSWCHNPEGLSARPQIMVSPSACTHCGRCREVCPGGTCSVCGKCVMACPANVRRIAGDVMSAEELARIILKDADYYRSCGGGVTFSGGEPLMQSAFLLEVIHLLPDVHCAVETSGYAEPEIFESVLRNVQYVMMDLKLMDEEAHRKYTGVSNARILHNARTLIASGKPCRIRIPLIPGVSDTEENLSRTAAFIASCGKAPVELLPYHKTAGAKYEMVGSVYQPLFDPEQAVQTHMDLFTSCGLECSVL